MTRTADLTATDRNRIEFLLDLIHAHTALLDPHDRQGASWFVAESVRLAKQYGFDDPDTVGDLIASWVL